MEEMSNKNSNQMNSESNNHKMWNHCNCGHCGRHMILRWIIGIIILFVVFGLGVMAGRFHSYGSRGMMHGGMYRQGMPMMRAYPVGGTGMMNGSGMGRVPMMTASSSPTTTTK